MPVQLGGEGEDDRDVAAGAEPERVDHVERERIGERDQERAAVVVHREGAMLAEQRFGNGPERGRVDPTLVEVEGAERGTSATEPAPASFRRSIRSRIRVSPMRSPG